MLKNKKFNWLHVAISWGASIVILGAMFKINHLGGQFGTYMIGIGLSVEATLFFILGFFPPAEDPQWDKVYPELALDYQGELPSANQRNSLNSATGATSAIDKLLKQEEITPEGINSLGEGLKRFSDKLSHINVIADTAIAADDFSGKLKVASSKYELLGQAFERATAGLNSLSGNRADGEAYHHQVSKLTHNLSMLNSLYEAELNGADVNLRQINHFYKGLSITLQNLNDSADDTRLFKDEVNKLSKNISALNVFYANMLSAMTQPRM
jgi:gliding motility-associated protein GldL